MLHSSSPPAALLGVVWNQADLPVRDPEAWDPNVLLEGRAQHYYPNVYSTGQFGGMSLFLEFSKSTEQPFPPFSLSGTHTGPRGQPREEGNAAGVGGSALGAPLPCGWRALRLRAAFPWSLTPVLPLHYEEWTSEAPSFGNTGIRKGEE